MEPRSPEEEDFSGRLLHQAALWDNAELLEDLLRGDQLANMNSQDSWGRTPLHAAATTEGSVCLRILLQAGADPNIPCGPRGDSRTPLHVCSEQGFVNNIVLLVQSGADLMAKDASGLTALDIAEKAEHPESMKILKKAAEARESVRQSSHRSLREACSTGDTCLARQVISELGEDGRAVINIQPHGSNTLLYLACECGRREIVRLLLEAGADGRAHPVTRYSPLYVAAVKGRKDIIDLLLKRFPELAGEATVEKWLPLHGAVINGHISIVEALLRFSYPHSVMTKYVQDGWEYELPFDVNFKDVTGQTPIYLACLLANLKMVEVMLKFKVKAARVKEEDEKEKEEKTEVVVSGARRRISDGIQTLMTRLSLSSRGEATSERVVSPWSLDTLCNTDQETALHVAVRNNHTEIASLLLSAGASPNLQSQSECVCLVEACRQRNISMVDLLLKYLAHDHESKALSVAITSKDDILIAKLLSIKAHGDPEYVVNKKALTEAVKGGGLCYTSLLANTPVMVNWHGGSALLSYIRYSWLVGAALHVNPKLKLNPKSQELVLFAITRLDISNNALLWLPPVIFQLQSLKILNIAQNKIERLPMGDDFEDTARNNKLKWHSRGYSAPLLEELYLQDNRLDSLPVEIFSLPSLSILDVSNNKLSCLPYQMWRAPKLKELNAAFNLLKDLPTIPNEEVSDCGSVCSLDSSKSVDTDTAAPQEPPSPFDRTDTDQYLQQYELVHSNIWSKQIEVMEHSVMSEEEGGDVGQCQLGWLNLAHNQLTGVPPQLPCLALALSRLNLSYNRLRTMSHITSYPASLRQLDLSGNQVCCWMSLPQVDCMDTMEQAAIACYAPQHGGSGNKGGKMAPPRSRSFRTTILNTVCAHRRHLRLDSLRTLILADNAISRLQLTTDDDGSSDPEDWDIVGGASPTPNKSKLMFPNLSMLDLSNNLLKEIPPIIHELSSLSVLNLSGNKELSDLPPQMGLLSRLWNLNMKGCSLQEPLKSMIDSKKYKTMDIIGYLKSVLEDAKPYARMKLMIVGVQGIGKTSLLEQLRSEGHKKKPVEHWAKRMGNKSINVKTAKGTNMSTVGVDIGDWTYEKKIRGHSSYGPVTFRTWDFGGQREYYATHQYFLSKRSLYIVVWRIPDGQRGISEILQWLVNIQARAPNSPVLIVGTHYDMMQENYPASRAEDLQQSIRERFINVVDAEKCGLPRVIDTIEVSCKSRHNIKILCNLIYDTVFSLRSPGSKTLLLQQCVPASYLVLEDVIGQIVAERRQAKQDPVLTTEQYRSLVVSHHTSLRDAAELHQATLFLHENGVLLHYEDSTLKDLYFVDPQWLCDMLAHVVTIREINPFARNGVMRLEDLKHVFKGDMDTKGYIVHLLNKFEVALTWDNRTLLIPSLLPTEDDVYTPPVRVKIPVRSRAWAVRNKKASLDPEIECELTSRHDPDVAIRRLLLMSYVPSGFWSRLITRILADDTIIQIVREFFMVPKEVSQEARLAKVLDVRAEWSLWQTGMELRYADTSLFSMKEVVHSNNNSVDYQQLRLQIKQEGTWSDVILRGVCLLELHLPLDTLVIKRPVQEQGSVIGYQAIVLEPSSQKAAHLLALATDHIDILLEDWYPTLGTRFVHTSEGKLLVTRIVPCSTCLSQANQDERMDDVEEDEVIDVVRISQESSDRDSGHPDSPPSSCKTSEEGVSQRCATLQYSWMVEECILAAIEKKILRCPAHGEISLAHVAPDTLFLDVGEQYLISSNCVTRGRLLGRGAFGFVFQGTCTNRTTGAKMQVAIKAIQPVPPPSGASASAVVAYKNGQIKWERDPIQHASKAYSTARQELGILLTVRHLNIVPLIGICIDPLCLVLALAPLGALHSVLKNYRRCAAALSPATLQGIVVQTAKALEYLHQQHIIYRDLKSENVLVWSIPPPFHHSSQSDVHIKLADYGISRLTLPSGTKGFGGTEGFMAPEIMKYNGEEEYTEKVDCFSFGMFLYELVTLHQPFESHESVKEYILEGGRPALAHRETHWPTTVLDLMVLCWSQQPCDRPTASQIVSISSAPEFTHLYDVVSLSSQASILASAATQVSSGDTPYHGVWLGTASGTMYQLGASLDHSWLGCCRLSPLPSTPTAATIVNDTVWVGDETSHIYAYSVCGYNRLWWYRLVEGAEASPVVRLVWLEPLARLAVALGSGRIFLVTDSPPPTSSMAEGSFVLTELGAATTLYDMAALYPAEDVCELWCGESHGWLSVYTIEGSVVTNHETLNHYQPLIANVDVVQVTSCPSDSRYLWTYVYPGCVVYQWDSPTRVILHKLDCSKLVPCSESLKSISIEEHLSPGRCQVTSMCVLDKELYVGTTWGCLVVAETWSLRPVTVVRPYLGELTTILALRGSQPPAVATFGRGYRPLISRFKESYPNNGDMDHIYAILWSTQSWVPP